MKSALLKEVEKIEIQDIPAPEIGEDDVLIKIRTAGVCGSDLHAFIGQHMFRRPPVILGHEAAGEISRVGRNVTRVKEGDHVVVNPTISCGKCKYCLEGKENLCNSRAAPGVNGWIGTFSEYFPAPADKVYAIPKTLPYNRAALTEPLANSVHVMSMIRRRERKAAAVIGCGTIGLLCVLLAKQMGYETIIGSDPVAFNRDTAEKLGATCTVDPLGQDIEAVIKDATGGIGVDACVVAASAPGILDQASDITKKDGEIILVAMMTKPLELHSTNILTRQQTICGSMLYCTEDFEKALGIVSNNTDLDLLLTHSMPLDEVQQAMILMKERYENVIKVSLTMNDSQGGDK